MTDFIDARQSLVNAKDRHLVSKELVGANVYHKEGQDAICESGDKVNLTSTGKWYSPWEKAFQVPDVLKVSDGTEKEWKAVVDGALDQVQQLCNEENGWVKSSANIDTNPDLAVKGTQMFRLKMDVKVDPQILLCSFLHMGSLGACDSSVLYAREHYSYRGDQTSLIHIVKSYGPSIVANRDLVYIQSWMEEPDGTIVLACKSVDNIIPSKAVPGCVRAHTELFGLQIRPKTIEVTSFLGKKSTIQGCSVVMVDQTHFHGMVPNMVVNKFTPKTLSGFLTKVESASVGWVSNGVITPLIDKYVLHKESQAEEEN